MSGIGGICKAKTELRWMRFVDGENFVHQGSKFLVKRFHLTTELDIGFNPRVIWKEKGKKKSKAVDASISVDMLSAAYENQFDLVEIWTGDADYIPLVNAVVISKWGIGRVKK